MLRGINKVRDFLCSIVFEWSKILFALLHVIVSNSIKWALTRHTRSIICSFGCRGLVILNVCEDTRILLIIPLVILNIETLVQMILIGKLLYVGHIQLHGGSSYFIFEVNLSGRHALSLDLVFPQSLDLLCSRPRSTQSCFNPWYNNSINPLISMVVSSCFYLSWSPNTIKDAISRFQDPFSRLPINCLFLLKLSLIFTLR